MSPPVSPFSPVDNLKQYFGIIPGISGDSYSVLAVTSARVYHAQLGPRNPDWCYSRLRGTLVFGVDNELNDTPLNANQALSDGRHWFRLLDQDSGKPVWMFKVPPGFVYEIDRPFFHAFQGRSRRFGFLFEDDDEAGIFSKKVISQTCPPRSTTSPKNRSLSLSIRSKSPLGRPPISPSLVSLPLSNSFVHVAHVGINKDGVIEASEGIDPSWRTMLGGHVQAQNPGFRKTTEPQQMDFAAWNGGESVSRNGSIDTTSTKASAYSKPVLPKSRMTLRRTPTQSFTMF